MAAKIKASIDGAEVELVKSGGGAFEVEVGGELLYSKRQTGTLPDEDFLVHRIVTKYKS